MTGAAERAHFCPFCGGPIGSFFGRFEARGAVWCEHCEDWFEARRVDDPGRALPSPTLPESERNVPPGGET